MHWRKHGAWSAASPGWQRECRAQDHIRQLAPGEKMGYKIAGKKLYIKKCLHPTLSDMCSSHSLPFRKWPPSFYILTAMIYYVRGLDISVCVSVFHLFKLVSPYIAMTSVSKVFMWLLATISRLIQQIQWISKVYTPLCKKTNPGFLNVKKWQQEFTTFP